MSIYSGKLRHNKTGLITGYIYLQTGNTKILLDSNGYEDEDEYTKLITGFINKNVIIYGNKSDESSIFVYDIIEDTPNKNYFYGKIVYLNNIQDFRFIDIKKNVDVCLKLSATHKFIKSATLLASFIDKNVVLVGLRVHDYIVFDDIKLLSKEKESTETGDNVALDGVLRVSIDGTFLIMRKLLNELDIYIPLFFDPLRQFDDLVPMVDKDVSIIGFYDPGNLLTFIVQDIMLCKDHSVIKKKQQNKKPKEKQVNDMYRFEIELD